MTVNNSDASCPTGALKTPLHRIRVMLNARTNLDEREIKHERSGSCGLAAVPSGRQQVELDLF